MELKHSDFKFGYSNESELETLKTLGIDLSSSINILPVRKQKFVNKSIESSTAYFVFDNIYELERFESFKETTKLLLRISMFEDKDEIWR